MNLIECKGISKSFGDNMALTDVSISVPAGQIFGLLGPNGAGKTTLIRVINQITTPDSGEVLLNGVKITSQDVAKIGYLPEERGLYKKMKIGEQALYLAKLKGMSRTDAMKELKYWFTKFGIESWWNKKVEELSKGMAQKIQFITTVVHKPTLLILDEPLSGFDPVNVQLIRNEILRMRNEGTTIMLSTHNMESVEELCDNIALINKSKLVVTGATDEIRRNYGKNQMEIFYRSAEQISIPEHNLYRVVSDEERSSHRRVIVELNKGANNNAVIESLLPHLDIVSINELIPRMNDIFIKLVSNSQLNG